MIYDIFGLTPQITQGKFSLSCPSEYWSPKIADGYISHKTTSLPLRHDIIYGNSVPPYRSYLYSKPLTNLAHQSNTIRQTGADLIASQGFKVYLPDFMKGEIADGAWFSPTATPEQVSAKEKFFSSFPGGIATQSKPVAEMVTSVKTGSIQKVGLFGYCWGYKVAVTSEAASMVDAIAGCHPS